MIRRIQALNYRCLRWIDQPMAGFQVLVGPNASGKSTFLDVIAFLGDLVSIGLDEAITKRSQTFQDLVWGRQGDGFELAAEFSIPEKLQEKISQDYCFIRYEISLKYNELSNETLISEEKVLLKKQNRIITPRQIDLFPMDIEPQPTLITKKSTPNTKIVVTKTARGNDNYYTEIGLRKGKGGWKPSFRLGPHKSALSNLPEDERKLPASTWLKNLLEKGIQPFVLNSSVIRKPSPPDQGKKLKPDGSNLPWVVNNLQVHHAEKFKEWTDHLRTALPDLSNIRTQESEWDRHRYLLVDYDNGLSIPSWMVSDGTLRLLCLTIPAYIPDFEGIYLIEEPENGIHPKAVEIAFQSLSSVYGAQMLLATHSPVILNCAEPEQVLCFSKNDRGATDTILGSEHPNLREWQRETPLGTLLAGGVLG